MALLCRKLATGEIDTALIQEPWVYGDRIRWLCNIRGTLFSSGPGIAPRSCICQEHSSCLSAVRALFYRCDDGEDDLH
jgi:hypothetical protein